LKALALGEQVAAALGAVLRFCFQICEIKLASSA
jgi:hypothetical protein